MINVSKILTIIPQNLLDCLEDDLGESAVGTNLMLQTRGDLQDIYLIIREDINNLEKEGYKSQVTEAIVIKDLMMRLSGTIGFEDARFLPRLAAFRNNYPELYKTFEVYAWG